MPHQVDTAFDALVTTKGLIFDVRGYPNGTYPALAARLADRLACRSADGIPLLFEPGAQTRHTFRPPFDLAPAPAPYRGKTVMLIDDRAQSQSEHTALILRAVHGTTLVGSAIAGANGSDRTSGPWGDFRRNDRRRRESPRRQSTPAYRFYLILPRNRPSPEFAQGETRF